MKNLRLGFCNLVMYYDVLYCITDTLVCRSVHAHGCESVMLHKHHLIIAKEDHPFVNGYDKSTPSYEKELPNRRVVAKVR